jgi:hypothetical protein
MLKHGAGDSGILLFRLSLLRDSDHILEQDLKRHTVTAALMGDKELAIAPEFTVFINDSMIVVIPVKCYIKFIEAKSFAILCIAFGFFQFADHSIVHTLSPFKF